MNEDTARIAAQWWADRIQSPVFDGLSTQERADPANNSYQMGEMMASMLVQPVTEEQRHAFIEALVPLLQNVNGYYPYVGVDYNPDRILAAAADAAGVPHTNFPWKTGMWIGNDAITVSIGYEGPGETLAVKEIA